MSKRSSYRKLRPRSNGLNADEARTINDMQADLLAIVNETVQAPLFRRRSGGNMVLSVEVPYHVEIVEPVSGAFPDAKGYVDAWIVRRNNAGNWEKVRQIKLLDANF